MQIIDGCYDIAEIKRLILEYTDALGRDLTFQGLEAELADPAKKYIEAGGEILAAVEVGKIVGMVVYRGLTPERAEMKRLYVIPEARMRKIGEALVRVVLEHAQAHGYAEMVLDTTRPMQAAIRLYRQFGFAECPAYYENPMTDVIYMRKDLKNEPMKRKEAL